MSWASVEAISTFDYSAATYASTLPSLSGWANNIAAGDTIFVDVTAGDVSGASWTGWTWSCADSLPSTLNVYGLQKNLFDVAQGGGALLFVCVPVVTAGKPTIVVSFSGATSSVWYPALFAEHFSGSTSSSVISGTPAGQIQSTPGPGTGTNAITSGNTTPGVNGCLIYSVCNVDNGPGNTFVAGTGFTVTFNGTANFGIQSENLTQATAAAIAGTWTDATNGGGVTQGYITFVAAITPGATGATAYSLTMTAGSYSLTGDSLTPRTARLLALTAGSYALTGDPVTLRVARLLALTAGAYSITGAPLTPRVARMLGLTAGSYALTGDALTPRTARLIAMTAGTYVLTGAPATFVWTHGGVSYSLTLSPGSYALTGAGLTAPVAYAFVTSAGAYILSGEPATLEYLTPEVGGTGGPPPGTARRKYVIDTRAPLRRDDPDPRPQQRPALPGDPVFTDAPEPVFAPQRPVSPVDPVVYVLPPAGFVLEPGTAVDVHGADGRALQGMTAQRLKAARQRQTDADVLAELGELIYLLNLL